MSEPFEIGSGGAVTRRLAEAVRELKNAAADRSDVVVDIREGQRTRLEMLAEDLGPVIADVPPEDERFDFAISGGTNPRFWIDAVAHVVMARDRRTYRFLLDTRAGRSVLAETADVGEVAAAVTRYVAERIVERERHLAAGTRQFRVERQAAGAAVTPERAAALQGTSTFLQGLGMVLLGALFGASLTLLLAWHRLVEMGVGP